MTLNGMSSDPHNGVNSLDLILMRSARRVPIVAGDPPIGSALHRFKFINVSSCVWRPHS